MIRQCDVGSLLFLCLFNRSGYPLRGARRQENAVAIVPTREDPLTLMRNLNEQAPEWLRSATVVGHWSGLRARPVDHPAPLLEVLEPGLILASGHYRNGVLLTPGTAEWVATAIEQE